MLLLRGHDLHPAHCNDAQKQAIGESSHGKAPYLPMIHPPGPSWPPRRTHVDASVRCVRAPYIGNPQGYDADHARPYTIGNTGRRKISRRNQMILEPLCPEFMHSRSKSRLVRIRRCMPPRWSLRIVKRRQKDSCSSLSSRTNNTKTASKYGIKWNQIDMNPIQSN